MTNNSSIPKELSPDLPEPEPIRTEWDELAELAAMTGYKPELPPGKAKSRATTVKDTTKQQEDSSESSETGLLDQEDLEAIRVETKTKIPFYKDPIAKGICAFFVMGLAIGVVGIFIDSFNKSWNKKSTEPTPAAATPQSSPSVDAEQAEIGRLKAVNALGNQAQMLNKQGIPNQAVASSAKPKKPATVPATPVRSQPTYTPAPTYTSSYRPGPPAPAPIQRSTSSYSAPTPLVPEVDPTEAWQAAMKLGSFGEGEATPIPGSNEKELQPETAITESEKDSRYEADAAAFLSGIPRRTISLTPGTTASATLTTPVVWAQDLKTEQQPQRFSLQLAQPLYAADGSVAFPAGTQMVARADAISESGLVQLSVVAVVTPTESGNQVVEIPPGTLLITGEAGKPLMAENQRSDRGQVAGMDLKVALMGALGQVGTLLNRPANQSTMTSPYLSTTSISNDRTSIVGGLLQGAFNPLVERMQKRQQREIDEVLQRPNLWYIPAGRSLQVFTNSLLEVSL